MASDSKCLHPHRIRHCMRPSARQAEKEALAGRLDRVCRLLMPRGHRLIDNVTLLNTMFDIVERYLEALPSHTTSEEEPLTKSF